ncbi:hypothetical protein ABKN59_009882 [Abortiporus biennis]
MRRGMLPTDGGTTFLKEMFSVLLTLVTAYPRTTRSATSVRPTFDSSESIVSMDDGISKTVWFSRISTRNQTLWIYGDYNVQVGNRNHQFLQENHV